MRNTLLIDLQLSIRLHVNVSEFEFNCTLRQDWGGCFIHYSVCHQHLQVSQRALMTSTNIS